MKTKNIIKLTLKLNDHINKEPFINWSFKESFFIEGLTFTIWKERGNLWVQMSNKDFSDEVREVALVLDGVLDRTAQIEGVVLNADNLRHSHDVLKRLKKVTNNQA